MVTHHWWAHIEAKHNLYETRWLPFERAPLHAPSLNAFDEFHLEIPMVETCNGCDSIGWFPLNRLGGQDWIVTHSSCRTAGTSNNPHRTSNFWAEAGLTVSNWHYPESGFQIAKRIALSNQFGISLGQTVWQTVDRLVEGSGAFIFDRKFRFGTT